MDRVPGAPLHPLTHAPMTVRMVRRIAAVGAALALSVAIPSPSAAAQQTHAAPIPTTTSIAPDQGTRSVRSRVTLVVRDSSLAYVVQELTRQAHLQLSYQDDSPAFARRVRVDVVNMYVMDALDKVLDGTGMTARLAASSDMVVIRPTPVVVPKPTGVVMGRVLDSASHAPLPRVTIRLQGTRLSTVTSDSGTFTLRDVPSGLQILTANLIGFRPVRREIAVSTNVVTPVILALVQAPTMLSSVVTTATGLQRRLAVGSDITTINVDSTMKIARITSVTDLLESRVPGLTVVHTSGTPGDPARIRLRGAASITGSNNPIVIVDGVRMYYPEDSRNAATSHDVGVSSAAATASAYPAPSPLDQIDPNTIETIDVFKGPSASSLYGSDAANGVIVITTKRGRAGPTHWSLSANTGTSYIPGKYPEITYGFGNAITGGDPLLTPCNGAPPGSIGISSISSVGTTQPCVVDRLETFQALNDPRFTPLTHGGGSGMTGTISGGVQNLLYSFTGSSSDERGMVRLPAAALAEYNKFAGIAPPSWMVHPDDYKLWSANSQLAATLNPKMRLVVSNQLTSSDQRRSSLGLDGVSQLIGIFVDTTELGTTPLLNGFVEQAGSKQTTSTHSATFDWQTRPWMHMSVVGGINQNNGTGRTYMPPDLPPQLRRAGGSDSTGAYSLARSEAIVKTGTLQASFVIPLPGDRRINLATGLNIQNQSAGQAMINTTSVPIGVNDPSSFVPGMTNVFQSSAASSTYGWYVQPQFTLSSRFFISPGLRLDGGSASGANAGLTLFPKADISWIAIDNSNNSDDTPRRTWQHVVSTLRLRGAYGRAGVQPPPAARLRLMSLGTIVLDGTSGVTSVVPFSQGNSQLRPERSAEFETGIDAELFDSRASLTATYYHKERLDAIMQTPVAPSAGGGVGAGVEGNSLDIGNYYQNVGTILNTGVEFTASAQIVRSAPLDWLVRMSASSNSNKLVSRSAGLNASPGGIASRLVVGYPIDGIWVRPFVGYNDANHDNVIQPNEIVLGDSNSVYVGTQNPRYTSTFGSTLAVLNRRLSANVDFDYQDGLTQYNAIGLAELRGMANAPGSTLEQRAIYVATEVAAQGQFFGGGEYLYQTVNTLRLNSASLTYTFPASFAQKLRGQSLSLSLQGSNLWLRTNYRGKDPNVNAYTTGEGVADLGQLPIPRVWTVRVNLTN